MKAIARGTRRLLRAETHPGAPLLTVVFVAFFRMVLEHNVQKLPIASDGLVDLLTDRLVFYAGSYAVFVGALRASLAGPPPGAGNIVAIGLLFGLFPPLLAAFVPGLGAGGYAYMTRWQLTFYDPSSQALSETITLWTAVVACGSFVGLVSGAAARALAAAALAYGGLAWLAVIAPSLMLSGGEHVPRGAAQGWSLRVVLAMTCSLALLTAHREALSRAMLRLPRALAFAAVTALSAWHGAASPTSGAMRVSLLLWLLVTVPDTSRSTHDPSTKSASVLLAFVAGLVALTLTAAAPQVGLIAASVLLLRITRQSVAHDVAAGAVRLLFDAITIVMAIALGSAPDAAR